MNTCNYSDYSNYVTTVIVVSCKFPVSFMQTHTHACNPSSATSPMQSRVCATPREPRTGPLRAASAVSAACRVVPPCRARVWSSQTDSQRLVTGCEGRKGAFGPLMHIQRVSTSRLRASLRVSTSEGQGSGKVRLS